MRCEQMLVKPCIDLQFSFFGELFSDSGSYDRFPSTLPKQQLQLMTKARPYIMQPKRSFAERLE